VPLTDGAGEVVLLEDLRTTPRVQSLAGVVVEGTRRGEGCSS